MNHKQEIESAKKYIRLSEERINVLEADMEREQRVLEYWKDEIRKLLKWEAASKKAKSKPKQPKRKRGW